MPSLPGGQIHKYLDDIAIVNYPCYYCNGFRARHREVKGRPRGCGTLKPVPPRISGNRHSMQCRVESYSGFRLHERPRRFTWGETWLEIDRIVKQWVTPDSFCFMVRAKDAFFLLEYYPDRDAWEVDESVSAEVLG